MLRSIVWYLYFFFYLLKVMPAYYKVNSLLKKGRMEERDKIVHRITTKWAEDLVRLAGAKVTVSGAENVPKDRTVLFVSNHQGYFDIPLLMGYIDKPKAFVAKIETNKIPIISSWMKQMNCIFLDRNDRRQALQTMKEAAECLKKGHSMVIFPEGTRSKGNAIGEFKAGAVRIAIKAKVPIVPVTIKGTFKMMEQKNFLITPAEVELTISEPIETTNLTKEQISELHKKVQTIIANKL
jgi:1-acyl-sn-glycerol-3-phosphate acyltransferase